MTGRGRRNAWLRMTDAMGLTEPGKEPERPRTRVLLFQVVLWLASALVWFMLGIGAQGEFRVWSAVLVLISLVLTVANLVMLRQSAKARKVDEYREELINGRKRPSDEDSKNGSGPELSE